MPELSNSARMRPAPIDCRTRLLLDPYLCVGPGCEAHAKTLFEIVQRAAALGLTLCVEREAWLEAAHDPDVVRRRVDFSRFEPVVKLDPLPLPSEHDAGTRCMPSTSETDLADLKLLGALHARVADQLIALDGRLHRLAARAGLSPRVLTPADALAWLAALAGSPATVLLRELDPRTALDSGRLRSLIENECEPFDPYLQRRLEAGRGRVLVAYNDDEPLALGVLEAGATGEHLELSALAVAEQARGAHVLEPVIAAALAISRRRGVPLEALLPPHEEGSLLLLEYLGFERLQPDAHGRERLRHVLDPLAPRLGADMAAWVLPLDAATHDRLLPELAGAPQSQLFAVGTGVRPQTVGSSLRKQVLLPATRQRPVAGDIVLFFHGRAARRPASACITAVARVERAQDCGRIEDVLALNACRPGYALSEIVARLADGPVTALDLVMLGRVERFLPLAWLKECGVLPAAPRAMKRLDPAQWDDLSGRLLLA